MYVAVKSNDLSLLNFIKQNSSRVESSGMEIPYTLYILHCCLNTDACILRGLVGCGENQPDRNLTMVV